MKGNYRSAFITGASSGIGAAFARVLPSRTELLLTARTLEPLERTVAPLANPERRVNFFVADLATPAGRTEAVERALTHGIDLFICNAGLGQAGGFLETPFSAQRDTLAVNVLAVVELLHGLLPNMIARARRERRRAGVIIVSSMGAFSFAPGLGCYGATKAFELHLLLSLAAELRADPIDLLALCPTYTETSFFARAGMSAPQKAMPAEVAAREAMTALGRRLVHLCSLHRCYPQTIRQWVAFNPALAVWRWPRRLAAGLRPRSPRRAPHERL
jgi:uncharacterized protein